MKCTKELLILFVIITGSYVSNAQSWKPVKSKIMTPWAEEVNPDKPLPEYPRPQLVRGNWKNLNGLWKYAITNKEQDAVPKDFNGQILVPFPVESALSGVGKTVSLNSALWYQNTVSIAKPPKDDQVLLHFGAVDWQCDVYINGMKVGRHEGGFDPFSFNITPFLKKGNQQDIAVRVWDPTDEGFQPHGKQVNNPKGIWYTPVTGIWQTVWAEVVPATYIAATKHTPDIDGQLLKVSASVQGAKTGDFVRFTAFDAGKIVGEATIPFNAGTEIKIPQPKLWSPDSPFLYQLKVELIRNGKSVDLVESYFAMRKSSLKRDKDGINRMALNNRFLFQYGPLDQGWWPDGLYTAPTDEALLFDIVKTKEMGFNMIRKHIKVEPARWYYYCDSVGLMVWQDMPSGDMGKNKWDMHPGKISGLKHDKERTIESENVFRKEWKSIIDATYNFPSVVVWVPFNEGWGQFKTEAITDWTAKYDPSRLVNSASGGNFFYTGDIFDIHNYPDPAMPDPNIFAKFNQALVLGEFGGLGLPIDGHTWEDKNNWGYQSFKNKTELLERYTKLMKDLKNLIPLGLSAAVYTQTTDVEIETNGILTYDRQIMKMPADDLKKLHDELYKVRVD